MIGLGPALWDRLGGDGSAAVVRDFPGYGTEAVGHVAPATQRDVWIWAHGSSTDVVIDVVRAVAAALEPVAELQLDVTGFTYHDSRDLTGFIDGTANPFLDEAPVVAVIPDGEPGEGGSCAMTMRFRHDLDAFDALAEHDQELVFGRTKADSVELAPTPSPPTRTSAWPRWPTRTARSSTSTGAASRGPTRPSRACTSSRSGATSTASTCSSATSTAWSTTRWSTAC